MISQKLLDLLYSHSIWLQRYVSIKISSKFILFFLFAFYNYWLLLLFCILLYIFYLLIINIKKIYIYICIYVDPNRLRLVGIFSKNREEWLEVDLANILYKAVTVSLYDTLGQESISYVINHSGIQVCFCNNDAVNTLLKTENIGKLNTIVAYDEFTNE